MAQKLRVITEEEFRDGARTRMPGLFGCDDDVVPSQPADVRAPPSTAVPGNDGMDRDDMSGPLAESVHEGGRPVLLDYVRVGAGRRYGDDAHSGDVVSVGEVFGQQLTTRAALPDHCRRHVPGSLTRGDILLVDPSEVSQEAESGPVAKQVDCPPSGPAVRGSDKDVNGRHSSTDSCRPSTRWPETGMEATRWRSSSATGYTSAAISWNSGTAHGCVASSWEYRPPPGAP